MVWVKYVFGSFLISDISKEAISNNSIDIHFDGLKDGDNITCYVNGCRKKNNVSRFSVENGKITIPVFSSSHYTLMLENSPSSIRFSTFGARDGCNKLFIKRSFETPDGGYQKLLTLFLKMIEKQETLEKQIKDLYGYQTE